MNEPLRSMQGKATFRGHPLHLMTISFPIAFWSGTIATDLAAKVTHDPFWFRMSVVLIAMGTITGLAASIFGTIDYYTIVMTPRARRMARLHAVGSLCTLVIFPLALLLRLSDHASLPGVIWTATGAVALFLAGYWGSELVMKHGIGIPNSALTTSRAENRSTT
jgi:uncharacterized membrane protein